MIATEGPVRAADDPSNTPPTEQVWRLRIYAMENDPEALLARVARDFPNARHATTR